MKLALSWALIVVGSGSVLLAAALLHWTLALVAAGVVIFILGLIGVDIG